MSAINLHAEMEAACRAVRQVHLDRLRALGVSIDTIAEMGRDFAPFGVVKAESSGSGFYQPGEGVSHIILPVIEDGELIDLVAFRTTQPEHWLLRTGLGWALGLAEGMNRWLWYSPADPAAKPPRFQVGQPTHLFSTPLDWLRGGGDGICVVDWASPDVHALDVLPAVTVSDVGTAGLLTRALSRPARLPKIQMMEMARAA